MTWRRRLVELSLWRMDIDRWAVVYLLVSAFYTVLGPGVVPHPARLRGGARGRGPAGVVRAAPAAGQPPGSCPACWARSTCRCCSRSSTRNWNTWGWSSSISTHSLDPSLIRLEQWIFGFQPSLEWSRAWPWPWFHELMEFAYFSYYFLAVAFLVLVFRARGIAPDRRWDAVRDFVRDLSMVMLVCYTLYTIFPAWGPKYFRAGFVAVDGWVFTAIMRHIHETSALLGAAFPSSHVAGSLVPWWHTWKWFPRHRWWMTTIFVLLCMSTVYNRYHYVVDVLAGLLLGIIVLKFGHALGDTARDSLRARRLRERIARARRLVSRTPRP